MQLQISSNAKLLGMQMILQRKEYLNYPKLLQLQLFSAYNFFCLDSFMNPLLGK